MASPAPTDELSQTEETKRRNQGTCLPMLASAVLSVRVQQKRAGRTDCGTQRTDTTQFCCSLPGLHKSTCTSMARQTDRLCQQDKRKDLDIDVIVRLYKTASSPQSFFLYFILYYKTTVFDNKSLSLQTRLDIGRQAGSRRWPTNCY